MKRPARKFLKSKAVSGNRNPAKLKHSILSGLFFIAGASDIERTLLALNSVGAACGHGKTAVLFDLNFGITNFMLKGCGLDRFMGSRFTVVPVNSGREIMTLAKKFMAVTNLIVIDSLDNSVSDSLFTSSLEEQNSWARSHQVQNHLIKTLKYEAEQRGVTIIATINHKLTYNYSNDCYYPSGWREELADVYVEISTGENIAPEVVDESGTPVFNISSKGIKPVLDRGKIAGFKTMLAVYHRTDIPRQYKLDFAYHDFYFGSGFQLDFSQRRLKNLLLTETTDTQIAWKM